VSETVYIETSILGHLTARPTESLILAANIKIRPLAKIKNLPLGEESGASSQ
jgi:hypothetical protein